MKIEITAKLMHLRGDRLARRGDILEAPKDGTGEELRAYCANGIAKEITAPAAKKEVVNHGN